MHGMFGLFVCCYPFSFLAVSKLLIFVLFSLWPSFDFSIRKTGSVYFIFKISPAFLNFSKFYFFCRFIHLTFYFSFRRTQVTLSRLLQLLWSLYFRKKTFFVRFCNKHRIDFKYASLNIVAAQSLRTKAGINPRVVLSVDT